MFDKLRAKTEMKRDEVLGKNTQGRDYVTFP